MERPDNLGSPMEPESSQRFRSSNVSSPEVKPRHYNLNIRNQIANKLRRTFTMHDDTEAEIQDLTRRDRNERTVLHRAALDQNVDLVGQLCERGKLVKLPNYVDTVDKFANTPLLSACVIGNTQDDKKLLCIKKLIGYGADPNRRNNTTLWTPLTWCAFYGDAGAVKILLDHKAIPYHFDKDGYLPLDHCGLQSKHGSNQKVARILITKLMDLIQMFDDNPESLTEEGYTDFQRYLGSPLLRTSILYWAIYFRLEIGLVRKLLSFKGVYPDMPLGTIYGRNCHHACAYEGDNKVFTLLLENTRHKTLYNGHLEKKRSMAYGNTKINIEREEADRVFDFTLQEIKTKRYGNDFIQCVRECARWIIRFENAVAKMVNDDADLPKYYEDQDFFGNTPLHIASFLGRADIVEVLLKEGADMLIENKDGWRCQELKQYPKIEALYKEYSKKQHRNEIADSIVGRDMGFHLQVLPQIKAMSLNEKPKTGVFNLNGLKKVGGNITGFFRQNKVDINETIVKQTNKVQRTLKQKFSIYNEERFIPDVVMVFQSKPHEDSKYSDAEMDRINFNISLIKTSFDCYLASSTNGTRFYLMIRMNELDLESECTNNGMKIKLLNNYGHQAYDATRKVDFEPFRSRQRQEITLASLNKLIDIQQLKDIGILKDMYTMHTASGIQRVKETWFMKKWYWPEPLCSIGDYIKEGKGLNFTAITTLRTYFGEKVAFYFAWVSFYTCYLLLLAIPGFVMSIITYARPDTEAAVLPIWSIYNSLCSTLVVERWKRKSSEIATRWGTIDMVQNSQNKKILRNEFVGDETVHETTGVITKINTNRQTALYFVLSVPILMVLLAAVIGSFLFTQYMQRDIEVHRIVKMLISAANGILISVINYLYMNIARYFVDKENHKYADAYEKSLIIKVFAFLVLNSNLGVIYVLFVDKETLTDIQFVLISLLITKQASTVTTSCIIPWLRYKLRKKAYFRTLKQKASRELRRKRKEKNRHRADEEEEEESPADSPVDSPVDDSPTSKEIEELVVRRPVLNCKTGAPETRKWDISRVELSAYRSRNDEFVDEFGQMFIQCGYITWFAPGFPLGPLISVVANIIDIRARLFALLYVHHRPPSERAGDIGDWQNIWEGMSILGIFVNAIILFFSSHTSVEFLEIALMREIESRAPVNDIRRLWVFLIIVNIILVIKLLVSALIKDKPDWVEKEEKRQNIEEQQAFQNQQPLTSLTNILTKENSNSGSHVLRKESSIAHPAHPAQSSQPEQGGNSARSHKKDNAAGSLNKYATYTQVPVDNKPTTTVVNVTNAHATHTPNVKEIHLEAPKKTLPLASAALDLNHGIKSLLFNAFTYVEKELMMKRLGHLGRLMEEVVLKCDACKKEKALLECLNCSERFCDNCMEQIHKKTVKSVHKVIDLSKASDSSAMAIKGVVIDVIPQIRSFPTRDSDAHDAHWQKMESFSFPTLKVGDPHHTVEKAYQLLYRIYIEENGIAPDNTVTDIDLALKMKNTKKKPLNSSLKKPGTKQNGEGGQKGIVFSFRDQQQQPGQDGDAETKEVVTKANAANQEELGEVDYEWLDQVKKFFEMQKFNLEEKLWMNRIAFMIFKKRGAKTSYNDFYRQLKILEEAPLEAKVMLLFDLVDEDSDGSISVSDLLKLLNVGFLQNIMAKNNQDEIVKTGLQKAKSLDKRSFLDEVLKNDSVKHVLMAYMQVKSDRT